jgi:hypothetical protein
VTVHSTHESPKDAYIESRVKDTSPLASQMFFPMERELHLPPGTLDITMWMRRFHGLYMVVDRLEHHKYPGLKCIMFSGEDEDYECKDVLVREEGHGYVVVDMYTCKT